VQEYRLRIHAYGFFAVGISLGSPEFGILGFVSRGSLSELPMASGPLAGLNGNRTLFARVER